MMTLDQVDVDAVLTEDGANVYLYFSTESAEWIEVIELSEPISERDFDRHGFLEAWQSAGRLVEEWFANATPGGGPIGFGNRPNSRTRSPAT